MMVPSIYYSNKLKGAKKNGEAFLTEKEREVASIYEVRYSAADEREPNYFKKYSKAFLNPVYVLLVLVKSGDSVIFTVFRFFIPKYLTESLLATNVDKGIRTNTYAFIVISSPIIGSMIGKFFVKAAGGYEKKKAILIILLFQFLIAAVVTPMPLFDNWKYFMVNAFIYHILSSAINPTINGVALASVDPKVRGGATNISKYITSGLVSGPAPAVYGLMMDHWKSTDSHFSMKAFSSLPLFGLILTSIAAGCRYSREKDGQIGPKIPIAEPSFDPLVDVPGKEKKKKQGDVEMQSLNA